MQIMAVKKVPARTCGKSCFFNTILDQPIKGEKRKSSRKYGENRYVKVQKSSVE